MSAQHTPGPWVAYEWECSPRFNEDGNRYWGIKPEKFHYGAAYLDASGWMSEANARLIAEAPAMLEALVDALPYLECAIDDPHYKPGRAAAVVKNVRAILARVDGGTVA